MDNPLLDSTTLPLFKKIKPKHVLPALETVLDHNRKALKKILRQKEYTWDNLIDPLERLDVELQDIWAPVEHLNAVVNSASLRKVYNKALPLLVQYQIELSHNKKLYQAIKQLAESTKFKKLTAVQKRLIEHALRDLKLSGIELSGKKKQRFAEIQQALTSLTTKFEENLLDCTNTWNHAVSRKAKLAGLPEFVIETAKQRAQQQGQRGWMLGLDFPTYYSVMQYADDEKLRKTFYEAYATRASDQGSHNHKLDNSTVMVEILKLREELAHLLSFKNFAELSLATKMAKNIKQVLSFLEDLAKRAKPQAQKELQALKRFAKQHYQVAKLNAWDIAYYSEKLKQYRYRLSAEELRPYFPEPFIKQGLFEIAKRLYHIHIEPLPKASTWHPDVKAYVIKDKKSQPIAYFYTDLYARPNKRGGAWMGECRVRHIKANGELQLPVAFLTCNFSQPSGDQPCLMTHDEVVTLFHEFGHCLHHLLTKATYPAVSGINGVPWDAVELPSQFMENWCWQEEAIKLISSHHLTKKKLPKALLNKMIKAKNFHSALMMLRQLEFSLFDFRLHCQTAQETPVFIQQLLDTVRAEVAVIQTPEFNRFQHSFSHIFAGGYAAGYYSYKWAEVLSSDAFSLFEEKGIFDEHSGKTFLKHILQRGGEADIAKLYKKFRGREATIDALLRHNGIG